MSFFNSINIASSGLTAQRLRMDVISDNIANATTTRTTEGGAYRRSRVLLRPKNDERVYNSPFLPESLQKQLGKVGEGVKVIKIEKDQSPTKLVWNPDHPDAVKVGIKKGYVEMPNVSVVKEMVDMISASRSYEANVTIVNTAKSLFRSALNIGNV